MTEVVHEHHDTADNSAAGWAALAVVLLGVLIFGGLYLSGAWDDNTVDDSNDISIDLPEDVAPTIDSNSGSDLDDE